MLGSIKLSKESVLPTDLVYCYSETLMIGSLITQSPESVESVLAEFNSILLKLSLARTNFYGLKLSKNNSMSAKGQNLQHTVCRKLNREYAELKTVTKKSTRFIRIGRKLLEQLVPQGIHFKLGTHIQTHRNQKLFPST